MKALKLVALGIVLICAGAAQAQVSVRFNLGVQPQWAPVGYEDTRYTTCQMWRPIMMLKTPCLFITKEVHGFTGVTFPADTEIMTCTMVTK